MRFPTEPAVLYRFYSTEGTLLYVGITVAPWERWRSHGGRGPWWNDAATVTMERFVSRAAASAAERRAIAAERPRHNIAHATTRPRRATRRGRSWRPLAALGRLEAALMVRLRAIPEGEVSETARRAGLTLRGLQRIRAGHGNVTLVTFERLAAALGESPAAIIAAVDAHHC